MSIVEVAQVKKMFANKVVLQEVDLTIEEGEIVGLIGPSGSGKTTLVKCMMGMEKLDAGTVKLLGTPIPNRRVLERVGYMAQSDALYEDLSARQNLAFFARLFRIPRKDVATRIAYVTELVDLQRDLHKAVRDFSGGMKRRLSLAIALIQDPSLLILDEPTVGIDPALRRDVWKELAHLRNQGKSILVTTHVMDEAEKCDRLALIRAGEMIAIGSPDELRDQYGVSAIEEVFL